MQKRIHHLDSLTIDKIAAGEVVDVPASCVKELVENALDAGATDILIEIQLGGRELIRVRDNGSGMCREDVVASIERHATSKIVCVEDLETISSMGFRGEALASIVAIARVRITSAEKNGDATLAAATTLVVEGGEVQSVTETKALPGTTIEVKDLFFNVPARRKFLKSPAKDTQDIIKAVISLSLASFHVAIRLIVDGKEVLTTLPNQDHIERARSLLAGPFQRGFEINHTQEGFSLCGIVAEPQAAKSNRTGQYIFVNGRSVFSLPISYAVKAGFGSACEQNKHPQFVLHLTLDPSTIDVNVHPQKKEIRFADEEWVRSLVQEKVFEAIFGKKTFSFQEREPTAIDMKQSSFEVVHEPVSYSHEKKELPQVSIDLIDQSEHIVEEPSYELLSLAESVPKNPVSCSSQVLAVLGEIALIRPSDLNGSLLLVDIKRAMKAVVFHDLLSAPTSCLAEGLLIPITVQCTYEQSVLLSSMLQEFEKQGFLIRPFGPTSFLVEGIPQSLRNVDVQAFILETLHTPDLLREKNSERRAFRLSSLYVSLMPCLKQPISLETATLIYKSYEACGAPKAAPDGLLCVSYLTDAHLKDHFLKR